MRRLEPATRLSARFGVSAPLMWGRASALQSGLRSSRPEGLPHMTTQVNRGFRMSAIDCRTPVPAEPGRARSRDADAGARQTCTTLVRSI
jgi:hypothetical protein